MPRIARAVEIDFPHHITQRGNYCQDIFEDDRDRSKYLSLLGIESRRYGLQILAYCLMANHVHFIGMPKRYDSMGNVFKYLNMRYSQYFNRKKSINGHLFQGRFFSCIMDEYYTMACARYIERNPVRAGIVEKPWDWKWSSARIHCGIDKKDNLSGKGLFNYIEIAEAEWKNFIIGKDNSQEVKNIKRETKKGRPLADTNFIEKLGEKARAILQTKPNGRPKKVRDKK